MNQMFETDKLFGLIDLNMRFELTRYKPVRALLKSRWIPLLPILINLFIFVIILLAAFTGGFSAGNYNFGIMIVWILWWVLLMLALVPGFSRAWCMVCPFPLFSDWAQRTRLFEVKPGKLGGLGLKWPKKLSNMWVMNIAFLVTTFFSGFITVIPIATFILLGIIILAAFIVGLIFEKRTFCLYLCPVSGFQGLYAQFATIEVRRKDWEICKNHNPKTCYVGNEKGYGCPWLRTPFDFQKNTYCGMCFECLKTCPYDNMAVNLRPPGVDLLVNTRREPRGLDEAWKAFIMLGVAIVFYLAFQGPWGWFKDMVRGATLPHYLSYITFHTVFSLFILPAVFGVFAYLSKVASGNQQVPLRTVFVNFAYTLIPMGLSVWMGFSVGILLPNGSYILHVLSDPFAWGWNLLGTAHIPWTPILTGWMGYIQGAILVVFFVFALGYGMLIARQTYPDVQQAKRGFLPILVFLTLITLVFLWLFIG